MVPTYQDKKFRSATRAGADLAKVPLLDETKKAEGAAGADGGTDALIALLKLTLKDEVKDVRASERLTASAVCLVSDENDPDIHLERLLKLHGQGKGMATKRILEVNPGHALIRAMAESVAKDGAKAKLDDAAWLLLDQARILEGEPIPDPSAFARRLAEAMARAIGPAS
jgi:molecular chaperone HtpG